MLIRLLEHANQLIEPAQNVQGTCIGDLYFTLSSKAFSSLKR